MGPRLFAFNSDQRIDHLAALTSFREILKLFKKNRSFGNAANSPALASIVVLHQSNRWITGSVLYPFVTPFFARLA
jgi:hypothetical protein